MTETDDHHGELGMASLNCRLRKLEQGKAFISGGAIVGAVLILGFFGFISFGQIPTVVRDSVSTTINSYIEQHAPGFVDKLEEHRQSAKEAAEEVVMSAERSKQTLAYLQEHYRLVRIESGNIDLRHRDNPALRHTDDCPSVRGDVRKRELFSTPFEKPPEVVLSLNLLDHVVTEGLLNNLRIRADVVEIDTHGFVYNLNT